MQQNILGNSLAIDYRITVTLTFRLQTRTQLIFKLTSKYKPIVCALKNYNLNAREKFEPGPGFESRTSRSLAQVIECQATDLEIRGSNPGTGSKFSLEFKLIFIC